MMIQELNPLFPPYSECGVQNICQAEFQACFSEYIKENSNDVDEDKEEVNLDDNYNHLSQLRVNKKVDKV